MRVAACSSGPPGDTAGVSKSLVPAVLAATALVAGSCVTETSEIEPIDPGQVSTDPIVLERLDAPEVEDPRDAVFASGLDQLRIAYEDRDPALMRQRLQQFDKPNKPERFDASYGRFRRLVPGVELENLLRGRGTVRVKSEDPLLGFEKDFEFFVPKIPTAGVILPKGGEEDGTRISVDLQIVDIDVVGQRAKQATAVTLPLPNDVALRRQDLVVPFRMQATPAAGIKREMTVRYELLPAEPWLGEEKTAIRRTPLGEAKFVFWPEGWEDVRDNALEHYRAGVGKRQIKYAQNAVIAAHFLKGREKQAAIVNTIDLLSRWPEPQVRPDDPQRAEKLRAHDQFVGFVTHLLSILTEADVPVGNKKAWMNWAVKNDLGGRNR